MGSHLWDHTFNNKKGKCMSELTCRSLADGLPTTIGTAVLIVGHIWDVGTMIGEIALTD